MQLSELGVNKRTLNELNKHNIYTATDMLRFFPRKYLDYRDIHKITEAAGKNCAVSGYIECVEKKTVNNRSLFQAEAIDMETGTKFTVQWYGQAYLKETISKMPFQEYVFCGNVTFHDKYGYMMCNPYSFSKKDRFRGKIVPVYTKYKGISEDTIKNLIHSLLSAVEEPIPEIVRNKSKLMTYQEALRIIHNPKDYESLKEAQKRVLFNDILYFSIRLKKNSYCYKKNSNYIVRKADVTSRFINDRPFALTTDQESVVQAIQNEMEQGMRVNALVQGDVGCGKTMVAFIAMFLMAENGFQSLIMAPTSVLAKQHYEELASYASTYGFTVEYLDGDVKGKRKESILSKIKSGKTDFIVGTHSLISECVEYKNLGLIVTDEEHRFGVLQREALQKKASECVHVISMSATPIPRSQADVLYGENKEMFTIESMPNGRKPVQTAVNNSYRIIEDFMEKQLKNGRQAYVVCPLIEKNEEEDNSRNCSSVEEVYQIYSDCFEPKGYHVAMVHGKMKKTEVAEVIESFKNNETQILVATTVIEVGVNVPNANLIVIHNAELFGLAQLHQLRGRVGRGNYNSYCILKSEYKTNDRLMTMERTTNGFEIAKEDLKLRGIGDLIGTQQSGYNHYAELIMGMPQLYESIKKYADWLITIHAENKLLDMYEETTLLQSA